MTLPDRSLGDVGHVADHDVLHERYNNSTEVRSGLASARPAAASVPAGTLFWATDTQALSRSDGASWAALAAGASDHGALTGLADDDHPQYATDTDLTSHAASNHVTGGNSHDHAGGDGAQVDHGGLAGLADDDHTQYLNAARHAAIDAADHGSGGAADGTVLTADGAGGSAWEAAAGGPSGKMLWSPGPHAYRAGAWYPVWDPATVGGVAVGGNVMFVGPFYVSESFNVDGVGFNVGSAGSGNVRVALYSAASDGRPGSLVVESASTAVPASGVLTVALTSTALTANVFYYAAVQFSVTGSVVLSTYGGFPLPHVGFSSPSAGLNAAQIYEHSQAFGAFPATPTLAVVSFSNTRPILFVRTV